jgi:hypothetical protein
MSRYKAPKISYSTDEVFAAACAAQRINGEYVKEDKHLYDTDGYVLSVEKVANKKLTSQFLRGDFEISDDDREQGQEVRQYCNSLTFKILQGKTLSEFEQTMLKIADKEIVDSFYEIAVVSSLPASYERSKVRREQSNRLRDYQGCLNQAAGTVVDLEIEVVRCNYSNNWNTYYVTAIVENAVVFFAFRDKIELGSKIRVKGKVKSHKEDRTQLSHVKVV